MARGGIYRDGSIPLVEEDEMGPGWQWQGWIDHTNMYEIFLIVKKI
jgi:hypothetical protein